MIEVLLAVSLGINILLGWYIVQLLKRFLIFQEELDYFMDKLKEYDVHLDTINQLERFYGDETLASLVRHSKDIVKECEVLKSVVEADYTDEDEDEEMYASEA
jgi:hypothetical protein